MSQSTAVRVFIGSGEASLLERKTLIYSLRKHCRRDLDIYVFNGTHNAVERNNDAPFLAPMSLPLKYRNVTEFSNYRFVIPEICNFQGRAIWLDSDMICLQDIGELFDAPLQGHQFLAKAEAYNGQGRWGLSVMLIDCAACRFDLDQIYREIDKPLYTNTDFHQMAPAFVARHPFRIGELDPFWNVFDSYDRRTKLIHYTNLLKQPWKFAGHPYGDLWFQYFREAQAAGAITPRDVELSRVRAYVRQDILKGHRLSFGSGKAKLTRIAKRLTSAFGSRAA